MSIQTQIDRIKANISSSYAKAAEKGAELPAVQNSANLPAAIAGILAGSDFSVPLNVSVEAGAIITAKLGDKEVSATANSDGNAVLLLTSPGDWSISASKDGKELAPKTVAIAGDYNVFFDFNAPLLPDRYVQLSYIDTTDANTYLDTGKTTSTPDKLRVLLNVEPLAFGTSFKYAYLFGGFRSRKVGTSYYSTSINLRVSNYSSYGNGVFSQVISDTASDGNKVQLSSDYSFRRMLVDWNPYEGYAQVNDESRVELSVLSSLYFNLTLGLPYSETPTAGQRVRFYSYKLYEEGELVQDLIPCKDPSGTVGMYDVIGGTFYSFKTSSSPFIAGPAV